MIHSRRIVQKSGCTASMKRLSSGSLLLAAAREAAQDFLEDDVLLAALRGQGAEARTVEERTEHVARLVVDRSARRELANALRARHRFDGVLQTREVHAQARRVCYDAPQPACDFRCGDDGTCPSGYACGDDNYCRVHGAPAGLSCPLVDAAADAFDFFPVAFELAPADDMRDVPVDVIPTVRFTEPVTGVTALTFSLVPNEGTSRAEAVVTYAPETATASLAPVAPLANRTRYIATLGAEIRDRSGKPLVGTTTWSFVTELDTTPPAATMVQPNDGMLNVAVDTVLVATFSEQVSHVTNATFRLTAGGVQVPGAVGYVSQVAVSFTPSQPLAPHTLYVASLHAPISDFAGNTLAGAPVTWSFMTGAALP